MEHESVSAKRFAEEYLDILYYYCLRRTGSTHEAEDLASEIAVQVLTALSKGTEPANFHAWMWQIARSCYSHWAEKKHKRAETEDISSYAEELFSDEEPGQALCAQEDIALLRRELSFLSAEYREVVVAYYLDGKRIGEIADALGIPEGSVKTRLFRARNRIKEGINMARTFGKRSYRAEEVRFAASGNQPSGLPWTAVKRKLPKNILLEAHNNPLTAEELSIALGTALPYMEEEIELLVNATLLKKTGEKYVTNFLIESAECQRTCWELRQAAAKECAPLFSRTIDALLPTAREMGISGAMPDERAKWELLTECADRLLKEHHPWGGEYPVPRANGETWGFVGYENTTLPTEDVSNQNGMTNREASFWAYSFPFTDFHNDNDWELPLGWETVGLFAELLRYGWQHMIDTQGSEHWAEAWKQIDGVFAHREADGTVVHDFPVFRRGQDEAFYRAFLAHPDAKTLDERFLRLYNDTQAVFAQSAPHLCEAELSYYTMMELCCMRTALVREVLAIGGLVLPAPDDPTRRNICCGLFHV